METKQVAIPVLGIPHYNRADLTARCIASIDYPVETLVVVVNNALLERTEWEECAKAVRANPFFNRVEVCRHSNAGVAGAWNEIIKLFPAAWWLISNNDIEFAPGDLEKLAEFVNKETANRQPPTAGTQVPGMVYGNHGASWFAITQHGVNAVGLFDENIYPAYLEDCDWSYRADLLGVRRSDCPGVAARHGDETLTGSCTVNENPELAAKNSRTHGGNFNYYRRKWGGLNGTEVFKTPFNDPQWPVWAWRFEVETRAAQQW